MASAEEEEFYRAARAWGRYEARRLGLYGDNAEECAQCFVVSWLLKTTEPPRWSRPREQRDAFLRTAAHNHAVNFLHSMQSEAVRFALSGLRDDTNSFAVDMVGSDAPDCRLLESLFWDKIQRGLGALTEDQNRLFRWYHLDGAPVSEIAGSCDGSADGVRHRLARMHHRLQSALTEQGDTEAELRDCLPRRTSLYRASGRVGGAEDVS